MPIQNFPEIFLPSNLKSPELFVYDYKMTDDVVNVKANLNLNLFSFLQTGHKKVNFANTCVEVNKNQSILIKSGNRLFTELLTDQEIYFCKLFFFSQKRVEEYLEKHKKQYTVCKTNSQPYFIIENDNYIKTFINSLSSIMQFNSDDIPNLLEVKLDEILLYLTYKYKEDFIDFLQSLIQVESKSNFKRITESNLNSNLKLEEIAFLCNQSLSTFKRHFISEYKESPGKYLKQKRLQLAKEILEKGKEKPSEIFHYFGYNNLSNFSIAFKNEFKISPNQVNILK